MICVAIRGPSYEAAHEQIRRALPEAGLIELRLDYFDKVDVAALKKLKEAFSVPMIFALKGRVQGGHYSGTELERLQEIHLIAALKPEYLDLESHLPPEFVQEIARDHPEIKLIISYHNYDRTPAKLSEIYHEMEKIPAALYKIAVTAHSTVNALNLICWARESSRNILAISMGPQGQISRILQPIIGGKYTYACLEEDLQTAPGQLTAKTLAECYRFPSLNLNSTIFGLIGDPVEQSLSHYTHNHVFKSEGINAVYIKMQVKAGELADFFRLARKLPVRGLSVTMPLKEAVLPFLDRIDEHARFIGATNTLLFEQGELFGCNTDGVGALDAIERQEQVKGKRIVIIGAGGAAKAIIYEACRRGGVVTVLNRDAKKAQQTASHFGCQGKGLDSLRDCYRSGYEMLINCTPVSMPIEEQYILPGTLVMDIKTMPRETEILKKALERGCCIVYGYEMFIEQAVGQFSLWNKNAGRSREIILQKIKEYLTINRD